MGGDQTSWQSSRSLSPSSPHLSSASTHLLDPLENGILLFCAMGYDLLKKGIEPAITRRVCCNACGRTRVNILQCSRCQNASCCDSECQVRPSPLPAFELLLILRFS